MYCWIKFPFLMLVKIRGQGQHHPDNLNIGQTPDINRNVYKKTKYNLQGDLCTKTISDTFEEGIIHL